SHDQPRENCRVTGKIDKPRALRLLANGHSKADVARVFHVSRAAVTQALRPVAAVETVAATSSAVVRPIASPAATPTVVSGNPRNPSDAEIPKPRPEDHEYDVQGWESKYLAWARARGTLARAAAYAGIRPRVAEARMAEDADFAQAVAEAQAEHADSL